MAGYKMIIIVWGSLLLSILISLQNSVHPSESSSKKKLSQTGFVLPQKHETRLTRAEQKGQDLYDYYCALCHGKSGKADGFNAYSLKTPAAKHADKTRMAARSDTQLQTIIREGGSGLGLSPLMPPWGEILADGQIADLTAYIRTLSR